MIDLTGKVALITGAAQGQGAAEAHFFAEAGALVGVADIQFERACETAEKIGANAVATRLDVREGSQWRDSVDTITRRFGPIDVLVNNAGLHLPAKLLESDVDQLNAMVSVNLAGVYHGVRIVGAQMVSTGKGSIVNVASVAALAPAETSALYGSTKAGVVNLTKGAALELGPQGVRVNCILPGGINTAMMHARSRPFFQTIPLGRLAEPIEVARVAAFFASDDSSYCTGSVLVVDGGWTLGPTMATLRGPTLDDD